MSHSILFLFNQNSSLYMTNHKYIGFVYVMDLWSYQIEIPVLI